MKAKCGVPNSKRLAPKALGDLPSSLGIELSKELKGERLRPSHAKAVSLLAKEEGLGDQVWDQVDLSFSPEVTHH